ncbi:MAG: NAD-dependent epimerase/dehydratase family protein [Polyangiaceae bacterium]
MKVLLTGSSGFLGTRLVTELRRAGATVVPTSRGSTDGVQCDLEHPESLRDVVQRQAPDAVVNAAAYGAISSQADAVRMARVNAVGCLALFEAAEAAGVTRFVHLGTAFEYGPCTQAVDESSALQPLGSYAASKAAGSLMLRERARRASLPATILRLFNLYGRGNRLPRLDAQIERAATAREPLSLTAGAQRRDFLDVGYVAVAIARVVLAPAELFPAGATLDLARGVPWTVREFAEAYAAALGAADLLCFGQMAERADAPSDLFTHAARWRALAERLGVAPPLEAAAALAQES